MKRIIFALLFVVMFAFAVSLIPDDKSISAYPPTTPLPPVSVGYPEFATYDCDYPYAHLKMIWYDPPVGVGSMANGLLYIWGRGTVSALYYDGWYTDIEGKIIHEWHSTYLRPTQPYYLDAYVRNVRGDYFWVNDVFYPPCFDSTYLPVVFKR